MLMVWQMKSQTTSTVRSNKPPKAYTSINSKGDTIVSFLLKDAKVILSDLLDYRIVDSLYTEFKKRDSVQNKEISLRKKDIIALQLESKNKDIQIANLNTIISNNEKSAKLDADTIKQQKKEIRKQKALKVVFMITTVVLPVLVLLATLK